mgnify:FL=1
MTDIGLAMVGSLVTVSPKKTLFMIILVLTVFIGSRRTTIPDRDWGANERRGNSKSTWSSLLLCSLIPLILSGYGGDSDKKEVLSKEEAIEASNELIQLRFRTAQDKDRFAASRSSSSVTEVNHEGPQESEGVANEIAKLQPGADWKTESLSAAAAERIRQLMDGSGGAVGFICRDLRPDDLQSQEHRGGFIISKWEPGDLPEMTGAEALADLQAVFAKGRMKSCVKVVSFSKEEVGFVTEILIELRGFSAESKKPRQVTAEWRARWNDTDPLQLLSLDLLSYEESVGSVHFVDATRSVLGETPHFESQVMTGTSFWASRITRFGDFSLTGHQGLAVGDVNGDGMEDLFVCDGGSLPNRLYVQEVDGTVRDVSAEASIDWLEDSRSALLIDLDNDGDQDLVVATIGVIAFAENDGSGKFTLRGGHQGARYPFSLSAADFDSDGDLDIYACDSAGDTASARGFEATSPTPFNDAENGGRNLLLMNLGAFQFADVTKQVGLDEDNSRWSFSAAWEDFDRDGDPDLYVANDFGRNCFYRNDDGKFNQISAELGVEDMASGMSVAWGDFNRDGAADLYVGNMFSSAGRRISYQENFGVSSEIEGLQRMARGNSLFAADGEGGFRDVSEPMGATMGRWAWSSGFIDVNNDGWEDIAVANGYLTGRGPDDL